MSERTYAAGDTHRMIEGIAEKLKAGERLDFEDGLALYERGDPWRVGRLAEQVTVSRLGGNVYYSVNRHINYTNICKISCRFCGFSRRPGQDGAYVMEVGEVATLAQQAHRQGASEVHIVGGVHPELSFDYYLKMLEGIGRACPELHIKAFTAVEIIDLAEKAGCSIEQTLTTLTEAGLGSLPGGGAEILSEDYFRRFCPDKPNPSEWLAVHAAAHRLGLMSNATMLYGYLETPAERMEHLLQLRQLQDESVKLDGGRFQCFVPLPYIAPSGGVGDGRQDNEGDGSTDVFTDMKTVAISRLVLDNFDHIKAFWPMLGVNPSQIALGFGADDLDGTVEQYRIVEQEGDNSAQGLSVEKIRMLITETGRTPVQRDAFYRPIG